MYKIYQIINIDGERYVGSTKEKLKRRYSLHKSHNANPNTRNKIASVNELTRMCWMVTATLITRST